MLMSFDFSEILEKQTRSEKAACRPAYRGEAADARRDARPRREYSRGKNRASSDSARAAAELRGEIVISLHNSCSAFYLPGPSALIIASPSLPERSRLL
jgi:hypothetical protein